MKLHKIVNILDSPAFYLASHSNRNECDEVDLKCYHCLNKGLLQARISTPFAYYIIPVLHLFTDVETSHMMCTFFDII